MAAAWLISSSSVTTYQAELEQPIDIREFNAEAIRRYKANPNPCIRLRNDIVKINMPLVKRLASKFDCPCLDYEDLVQFGCIGLIRAIDLYEINKSCAFGSFAYFHVRGAMSHAVRDHGQRMRYRRGDSPHSVSSFDDLASHGAAVGVVYPDDLRIDVKDALDQLPEQERIIVTMVLLEQKTKKDAAEILGISISTVTRNFEAAKLKLKVLLSDEPIESEPEVEAIAPQESHAPWGGHDTAANLLPDAIVRRLGAHQLRLF